MPHSPHIARGMALSNADCAPRFESINRGARDMFPDDVVDILVANAKIHLYSNDWKPRDPEKKKEDLARWATSLYKPGMGMCRKTFVKTVGGATKPELGRLIESMEGERAPEIFIIANLYGSAVDRAPPYRQEVHPVKFVWARMKGARGARYEAGSARGYIATSTDSVEEEEFPRIVAHCDRSAGGWS